MNYEERCAALGISRGALAEGFPPNEMPDRLAPKVAKFHETRESMRTRLGLAEGDLTALNPKTTAHCKIGGSKGGKMKGTRADTE